MLSSGRTVLSMMDEALYIYKKTGRVVQLVDTVPWDAEGFERSVSNTIATKCQKRPVVIVNDMVEQHYRKERVLTSGVSLLDRKSMVQRKLNMAFPNYPVKASLPLKEKIKGEGGKMSSDVFIFAAVPNTPQLVKTIGAVNKSLSSTKGLVLLPVESASLVNELAKKLRAKNEIVSKWVVMIGQHKNGSLRQIVTKNGEIALTRMSPIIDSDKDPQKWANEVIQEFRATMSYLTRFGFKPEDGLDIILLSNPTPSEIVAQAMDERFSFQALTPTQAAGLVGLSIGPQEDERYADSLHIAWIGKKVKYILPMSSKLLESVARPRQLAAIGMLALLASAAFFAYKAGTSFTSSINLDGQIQDKKAQFASLNSEYQIELKKKEALGFDVKLIQSSMNVYKGFQKTNVKPLNLLKAIGMALGNDLRIDKINIKTNFSDDGGNTNRRSIRQPTSKPLFESVLQITYPSTADIIKGNAEINNLAATMQQLLPDHTVRVTKLLKDYNYVEEITVESGNVDTEDVLQDFIAEITIEGPVING